VNVSDLKTLDMFEARAQAVLPADAWAFAYGGSSSEVTLRRNRQALQHLAIEQRVLMNVRHVDLTARFLDMELPSPIIVAPMGGMSRFHPQGDVEMARGATRAGGMSVVAGGAPWPLEEIAAAASGPLMFQLYWLGDRQWVAEKLLHVVAGGYKAFCLTVDSAVPSRRDRDIEHRIGPGARLGDAQAGLTWDDVDWVRHQIPLPFGVKGVLTVEDAMLALEHGVDFIWLSNHGGRQLDDGRATIDVLPEVADVVDARVPIIVDSGFRRGTDAIKALALGATLVAYGRTALWGLASGGADGVQAVLRILNEELMVAMKLAGRTIARELPREMIRRVDASGFAEPMRRRATGDPESDLMAQLSRRQREVIRGISENSALSEVDKMWGITEALFGATEPKG
jgi:isopentenyl diphosphate isomerase/L-lactate dehydrogenase-like FMN-dependent dehydrogenase